MKRQSIPWPVYTLKPRQLSSAGDHNEVMDRYKSFIATRKKKISSYLYIYQCQSACPSPTKCGLVNDLAESSVYTACFGSLLTGHGEKNINSLPSFKDQFFLRGKGVYKPLRRLVILKRARGLHLRRPFRRS